MDILPSQIIEQSFKDQDEIEILRRIGQAMKLITDNLPFEETYPILAHDQFLVKYLVLSLPFNPEGVEKVINLLMYMLQDDPSFYRNLFVSVTEVVMLQPKNAQMSKDYEDYVEKLKEERKSQERSRKKLEESHLIFFDSRVKIGSFPSKIRRNIVSIKKMTLVIVQKAVDILKTKYEHYEIKEKAMISDCLYSYFKHLLIFSKDLELISFIMKTMRNISSFAPEIIRATDVQSLNSLSKEKTKEQQDMDEKNEMRKTIRERKLMKLDKKTGILKFKNDISKMGLIKTIKSKMKTFLKRATSFEGMANHFGHDLADFKDFLEEFLISGNLKIASNGFLVNYLKQDDRNLDILIKFITNPFSYSVSDFFVEKHKTFTDTFGEMDFCHPRSFEQFNLPDNLFISKARKVIGIAFNHPIADFENGVKQDVMHKEVYYIRSFYALMFFTDRDNHIFLIKNNKTYIDVMFGNLYKCLQSKSIRANMNLVLFLYKFYLNVEPTKMVYNLMRFNLVHQLVYNLDKTGVVDFVISLVTPFDMMVSTPKKVKCELWKYLKESGFFLDLSAICLHSYNVTIDYKFDKSYQNSEMNYSAKQLDTPEYELRKTPLYSLMSQDRFYSTSQVKEIVEERVNMGGLDIDQIFTIPLDTASVARKPTLRTNKSVDDNDIDGYQTTSKTKLPLIGRASHMVNSSLGKASGVGYDSPNLYQRSVRVMNRNDGKRNFSGFKMKRVDEVVEDNISPRFNPPESGLRGGAAGKRVFQKMSSIKAHISNFGSFQQAPGLEPSASEEEKCYSVGEVISQKRKGNMAISLFGKKKLTFAQKKSIILSNRLKNTQSFKPSHPTPLHSESDLPIENQVADTGSQRDIKLKLINMDTLAEKTGFSLDSHSKLRRKSGKFEFVRKPAKVLNYTKSKRKKREISKKVMQSSMKLRALKSLGSGDMGRPLYWFNLLILSEENRTIIKGKSIRKKTEKSDLFLGLKDLRSPNRDNRKIMLSKKSSFRITIAPKKFEPTRRGSTFQFGRAFATPALSPRNGPRNSNKKISSFLQVSEQILVKKDDLKTKPKEGPETAKKPKKSTQRARQVQTNTKKGPKQPQNQPKKPAPKDQKNAQNHSETNLKAPKPALESTQSTNRPKNPRERQTRTQQPSSMNLKPKPKMEVPSSESSDSELDVPKIVRNEAKNSTFKRVDSRSPNQDSPGFDRSSRHIQLNKSSRNINLSKTDQRSHNPSFESDNMAEMEASECLYPGKPVRVDIPKEIENLIMSDDFTHQSVQETEYLSLAAAKIVYYTVKDACEYNEDQLSMRLGFEKQDIITFWYSMLGASSYSKFFENIYLAFLLKFEHSVLMMTQEATGFLMLQTINLIIKKMIDSPLLQKFKRETNLLFDRYLMYFDELVHNIYQFFKEHRKKIKPIRGQRGIKIPKLSIHRLALIEHFFLIVKNHTKVHENSVVTHLNLRLIHIMVIWINEHFGNQIVINKFVSFLNHCFTSCFESVFIDIFIKLNFVSNLLNVFKTIYKNSVFVEQSRSEDKFFSIREIVKVAIKAQNDEENFPRFSAILKTVQSWQKLITGMNIVLLERKALEKEEKSSNVPSPSPYSARRHQFGSSRRGSLVVNFKTNQLNLANLDLKNVQINNVDLKYNLISLESPLIKKKRKKESVENDKEPEGSQMKKRASQSREDLGELARHRFEKGSGNKNMFGLLKRGYSSSDLVEHSLMKESYKKKRREAGVSHTASSEKLKLFIPK